MSERCYENSPLHRTIATLQQPFVGGKPNGRVVVCFWDALRRQHNRVGNPELSASRPISSHNCDYGYGIHDSASFAGNLVPTPFPRDAARACRYGSQSHIHGLPSSHARRLRGSYLGYRRTKLAFVDSARQFRLDVPCLDVDDAIFRLIDTFLAMTNSYQEQAIALIPCSPRSTHNPQANKNGQPRKAALLLQIISRPSDERRRPRVLHCCEPLSRSQRRRLAIPPSSLAHSLHATRRILWVRYELLP